MDYRTPSPPPSSDLRTLLIVVGILMCLAALGCGIGSVLYLLVLPSLMQALSGSAPGDPGLRELAAMGEQSQFFNIMGAAFYLISGAFTLWLGIGVIRCRRWAWRLSYTLGWFWIGMIALTTISYMMMAPAMLEWFNQFLVSATPPPASGSPSPATPPAGLIMVGAIVFFVLLMLFYAAPGVVLVIIFGLRNVRLTCEYHDPVPRWTDRVPVPVLILWLLLALGVPGALLTLPMWMGIGPVKMENLNPAVGGLVSVLGCILYLMGAIGLSRMKFSGWLAGFIGFLLFGALYVFAMWDFDTMSIYEGMMSEEELQMMAGMVENLPLWELTALFFALILLYMLFTLKYFRNRPAIATGPGDPGNPYNPPGLT